MYLALSIIFLLFLATFIYAGLSGATWVPTKKNDVKRFLKLANLKSDEKFYDLGCGNGRMIISGARQGATAVGLEISLFPYLLGKLNIWLNSCLSSRLSRDLVLSLRKNPSLCSGQAPQSRSPMTVKILYRDLWKYNLSDANVIYFFLMPDKMKRLKEKFEQELKPGTRVISYVWPIDGWQPIKIDECEGWPKMFLYKIF